MYAAMCVTECKRQYVARYKTTYRPQSKARSHMHTHIHTRTYGNSQNAQAKIAANYMRLQSRQAFALIFFFAVPLALLLFLCLLSQPRALHNCFHVASFQLHTFGSVLGNCFCRPHIRDKHARCFVLLLRRPAAPKSRPTHPVIDKTLTTTQYHRLYTALCACAKIVLFFNYLLLSIRLLALQTLKLFSHSFDRSEIRAYFVNLI